MLILLIFLSTPIRIEAGREPTPPCTSEKTRAGRDYSQGKSRTQGKIAKKAGKMKIFLEACGNHRLNSGLRAIRTPSEQVRGVEVEGNSPILDRSEERRVGKECRARWSW